jgi:hypothetical protein
VIALHSRIAGAHEGARWTSRATTTCCCAPVSRPRPRTTGSTPPLTGCGNCSRARCTITSLRSDRSPARCGRSACGLIPLTRQARRGSRRRSTACPPRLTAWPPPSARSIASSPPGWSGSTSASTTSTTGCARWTASLRASPPARKKRWRGPSRRPPPASARASHPWRTPCSRWPRRCSAPCARYSHSMVPGGLLVMSSTTRLTSRTSLVIRVEIRASTSYGSRAQSAVIASSLVTGLITTGWP